MNKLAFALLLAAAACSKKESKLQETGSAAASGSGSGSAPLVIPPYDVPAETPAPIKAAVTASDRADADRALDAGRKPAEMLTYFKIAPGQKVLELFAGGGYTSELLNRVLGSGGKLYAQNTKEIMDKFARKPWSARAAKPAMAGVESVERPIDDPIDPAVKDLDAVVTVLNYHDAVNMQGTDRGKMNKAIFAALKPGGIYGIVDSSAKAQSGVTATDTLHRIDEEVVKKEVLDAGFTLDGESDALREPSDTRDWNASPRAAGDKRGKMDKFMLRFVKPAGGAVPAAGSGSGSAK